MKDETLLVQMPTPMNVSYLSATQILEYGGIEQAKQALGTDLICCPTVYAERTIGQYPFFHEVGHA